MVLRRNDVPTETERLSFEHRYQRTLRLPSNQETRTDTLPDREATALVAALKRAYELRNFEIEHYWKRGTYFWGFQLAIFAAYGLLWKEGELMGSSVDVALALASLGILTAFANVLSIKGSKFWYTNWERHIDMLEDQAEGRLHRIVWLDRGLPSFSVTRVNQVLGSCFLLFWVIVACKTAWVYPGFVPNSLKNWLVGHIGNLSVFHINAPRLIVGSAIFSVACLSYLMWRQRTNLSGTIPTDDGDPGPVEFKKAVTDQVIRRNATYILRHGPVGDYTRTHGA